MTISMYQLQLITGWSRTGINKVIERNHFSFKLEPIERGKTRYFSTDEALELAFGLGLLKAANIVGSDAFIIARECMSLRKKGKLPNFWAFNPKKGFFDQSGRIIGWKFNDDVDDDKDKKIGIRSLVDFLTDTIEDERSDTPDFDQPASYLTILNIKQIVALVEKFSSNEK